MSIQMHVAFSNEIGGVCGFDAQPYHCAATRFPGDNLVPQTAESSVPNCDGCPMGETLIYDHCKGHSEWVDVGMLPDYPRRICGNGGKTGCIDDTFNLKNTTVFLARSECRTYTGGAEVNALALYAELTTRPDEQLLYYDSCAGRNDTAAMCWNHVLPKIQQRPLSKTIELNSFGNSTYWQRFHQSELIDDFNVGFDEAGWIFIPEQCKDSGKVKENEKNTPLCSLMVLFHGCGGCNGIPSRNEDTIYAEANGVVLLKPCMKNFNNVTETFKNAFEIQRGCWDGYGQLDAQYALQSAPHMRNTWNMIRKVSGSNYTARQSCKDLCG
eukprot:g1326.t1